MSTAAADGCDFIAAAEGNDESRTAVDGKIEPNIVVDDECDSKAFMEGNRVVLAIVEANGESIIVADSADDEGAVADCKSAKNLGRRR